VTQEFSGKSVLITGADRGIGKAIAVAFAKAGASVAAHGLADPAQSSQLIDELRTAARRRASSAEICATSRSSMA
jgi:NAD(P)-dependent dehydrogenase (short-subunit alcohol dehydrogenase family)